MNEHTPHTAGSVLLASLMLPGLATLAMALPTEARAESPPEKSTLSLKYGNYQDSESGWTRVTVNAPQIYLLTPIGDQWSVEASGVVDSVSGASPRMHTLRSGASHMTEERKAGDVKVTRYLSRAAISASLALSDEHDYRSRALGLQARWSSDDNNRTWTVGTGLSRDRIDNQSNGTNTAINQRKSVSEVMGGITQVLTPTDIAQFNLTRSTGSGYYNDPYKLFDNRPDKRDTWIGLARWNHHLTAVDTTARTSYRYYSDSFGIRAHTWDLELVKAVGPWTFTPGVRYYMQNAASFYFDPVLDSNGGYNTVATMQRAGSITGFRSADQRLSAFGAWNWSMKVSYALSKNTTADVKLDLYRQAASLRIGGGSPGLSPMNARTVQVGLTRQF
jgi:Protein of unknown function (DUF3570)